MKSDRRLVEDIEHPARESFRSVLQDVCAVLHTARERAALARKREIIKSHGYEEPRRARSSLSISRTTSVFPPPGKAEILYKFLRFRLGRGAER